jgi:hypothetical protein
MSEQNPKKSRRRIERRQQHGVVIRLIIIQSIRHMRQLHAIGKCRIIQSLVDQIDVFFAIEFCLAPANDVISKTSPASRNFALQSRSIAYWIVTGPPFGYSVKRGLIFPMADEDDL